MGFTKYFVFFTCSQIFTISNASNATYYSVSSIIADLIDNYDNRLRPNFGGNAVEVQMELVIASFDKISEVNMDYTITMCLNQYWQDERLAFDPQDPQRQLTLTGEFSSKIWVPDTYFANDKHSYLHDVTDKNKMVRLFGNGKIFYGMRFTTTLACMMDLHFYPLDEQNCTVEIESYGYPVEDVKMIWREEGNQVWGLDRIEMPQFTILSYDTRANIMSLSTGNYNRLALNFRLRRNLGFFILQTYLPSILIVTLSWVSFWINHEATSARVALGITTVLTMTTISTGVRSSLPRISYVKAIDIYLVIGFAFVFAALLEYAAVNYTYWGARAKRKAKRSQSKQKNRKSPGFELKNDKAAQMELSRLSPLPGIGQSRTTTNRTVNLSRNEAGMTSKEWGPSSSLQLQCQSNSVCLTHNSPIEVSAETIMTTVGGTSRPMSLETSRPCFSMENDSQLTAIQMQPRTEIELRLPRPVSEFVSSESLSPLRAGQPTPFVCSPSRFPPPVTPLGTSTAPPTRFFSVPVFLTENNVPRSDSTFKVPNASRFSRGRPRRGLYYAPSVRLRRAMKKIPKKIPKIEDVNVIDKYSRILFPSLFILFNIGYWCFYLLR